MKINDIGKQVTAKSLNESLASRFGKKIDLERFTVEQLEDARNKLRTKLHSVETMESFDSVHNETYQRTKLFLDVLNAEISERGGLSESDYDTRRAEYLKEGEEDKAELVMAAKQMVERLTGWMEDVAEMQTEAMLDLSDSIRDEMGHEAADSFVNTVKPGLESLYATMEETRKSLTSGVGLLTGDQDMSAMGADPMAPEADVDPMAADAGGDISDIDAELGAEAPDDMGGDIEEPVAGRMKRESIDPRRLGMILSKKK
jgi:hypothetical protein